jgi:hypothetical protein
MVEIDYSIDGGPRTFAASGSGTVVWQNSNLVGLFNVLVSVGTSNSPGGQQALVTQSNNAISTLYSSGTHTLTVYVSSAGFTSPQSPPPTVLGNASSITENSGHTSVVFTSYADKNNAMFGMSGSSVASTSVAYSVTGQQGTGTESFTSFSPNGNTYSLTNEGDYTMAAGTSLTVVSGNTTVTPTPAPTGAVLALTGLPCLGFAVWLRRRNT